MNINHQTQPTKNSCVSACLAMVLDTPVSDVIVEFHADYMENNIEVDEYLHKKGKRCRPLMSVGSQFLYERIYFLSVPSLNEDAMLHQILGYWVEQEFRIADPNEGYDGRRYYVPDTVEDLKDNQVKLKSYTFEFEVWS